MLRFLLLCAMLFLMAGSLRAQLPPIGNWRSHLPYQQAIQVAATTTDIWCATPYSLFSVDRQENSIERLDKLRGLHETGISCIAAEESTGKLVIAYTNSNVDILDNGKVHNIDVIKNSSLNGDKSVYSISTIPGYAFLCTGAGIIVIDMSKYEVKDTYIIGDNGIQVKVNAFAVDNSYLYAATEEGLKRISRQGGNPADFHNWSVLSGSGGLPAGEINKVINANGRIIAMQNDTLYAASGGNWNLLYGDGWNIRDISASGNNILLSETKAGAGRIIVTNLNGTVQNTIQQPAYIISPRQSLVADNEYWIADTSAGLVKFTGTGFQSYLPNSPAGIALGAMQVNDGQLWAAGGSVTDNWDPAGNKGALYHFSSDGWQSIGSPQLDSFPDLLTLAVDITDRSVWAGSYGGGLLNLKDNTVTAYKQNSPLQPAYFAPGSHRVAGLAFDASGNLWIANYGAAKNLVVRKKDGNWQSFAIPFPLVDNAAAQILVDDTNQLWIVSPKGNGLICFDPGASIDNIADDRWKWYRQGKGNGNLPDNNVLSIAKDKSGFIWVGTAKGIGIIQCTQQVFTQQGCEALIPVVQQGNFAGYLFSDEQVQTIAVDGADRKWVGTKNGAWLISPEGDKIVYRFDDANSPLPDKNVKRISIDDRTGEVFFATVSGTVSFRSTATSGGPSNNDILVFPNPVPPGYNGAIAIRGVANNAIVKITELDGRLVYQARSLGGQAIWNGRDYKGRRPSTGVYLVFVSDDSRNEKLVTKIVFVK